MPDVLASKRFWTFVVAQVLTIGIFVYQHYVTDPWAAQLATMVVGMIEGVAAILIAAYTTENVQAANIAAKAIPPVTPVLNAGDPTPVKPEAPDKYYANLSH
jgi:uncharacterized YccA/Bax inhibitor family protein